MLLLQFKWQNYNYLNISIELLRAVSRARKLILCFNFLVCIKLIKLSVEIFPTNSFFANGQPPNPLIVESKLLQPLIHAELILLIASLG